MAGFLSVVGFLGTILGIVMLIKPFIVSTRTQALIVLASSFVVMLIGGALQPEAQPQPKAKVETTKKVDQTKKEEQPVKTEAEKDVESRMDAIEQEESAEMDYRNGMQNLAQRMGFSMTLVSQGFNDWAMGDVTSGREEVKQAVSELNDEVQEAKEMQPPTKFASFHQEFVEVAQGYHDTVEKAMKAADNGDVDTLSKCVQKMQELNQRVTTLATKAQSL